MTDAIDWPLGWPRTPDADRQYGNFTRKGPVNSYGYHPHRRVTISEVWNDITDEVRRLDGSDLRVDVDRKLNRDGSPSSSGRQGDDPGAVVHFRLKGRPLVIACDRFKHPESNLRAIAILLNAKRTLARYGFLDMTREFEGYAALPAGAPVAGLPHLHTILGVKENSSTDEYRQAWRAWALENHPDKGGDHEVFVCVKQAVDALEGTA